MRLHLDMVCASFFSPFTTRALGSNEKGLKAHQGPPPPTTPELSEMSAKAHMLVDLLRKLQDGDSSGGTGTGKERRSSLKRSWDEEPEEEEEEEGSDDVRPHSLILPDLTLHSDHWYAGG